MGMHLTPHMSLHKLFYQDFASRNEREVDCIIAIVDSGSLWTEISGFAWETNRVDDSRKLLILEMMDRFRHFDATDPRDKLFAFLGFESEIQPGELLPEYNLSVAEVYGGLAKFCIEKHRNLDVLGYCFTGETTLASWIPDWRSEVTRGKDRWPLAKIATTEDKRKVYSTSRHTEPVVRFMDNFKTVTMKGFYFDFVCEINRPADIESFQLLINWYKHQLDENYGFVGGREGKYVTGETVEGALARTIVADCTPPKEVTGNEQRGFFFPLALSNNGQELGTAEKFALRRTCRNRRLFSSQKGYMGMAPKEAQESDLICVLLGCEVPFVLRMVDGGHYRLIRECYVHGIMDGEAMTEVEDGRIVLQDFVIQ